ncbi:MAG: hypothetical protein HFJ08_06830 [Lachnospiraceae bacterium]|nr:hypothetical protein [Lachnospiraceae bacterium]
MSENEMASLKKVIIYGLGNGRLEVEKVIASGCEIIAYTDGVSRIDTYNGKKFIPLDCLYQIKFDCIIISIKSEIGRERAKVDLIQKYAVDNHKIIVFYKHKYYLTKVDKVMNGKDNASVEGIILGMSTAEYGILASKLKVQFCNLAMSSQDIFYNYNTFKYVLENYRDKLDLKYILIDMYDYRWFNYDLSLSKSIEPYICEWNGLRYQTHNLERNINFSESAKEKIKQFSEYQQRSIDFEYLTFTNYYGDTCPDNRAKCIEDREYTEQDIHPRLIDPIRREETIKENKNLMDYLLREIRRMFPSVKIILLLLPRYVTMNRILERHHAVWKEDFFSMIERYIYKYDAEFNNYRDYAPISENPYFFYDLEHLNYTGATAFSSLLAQKIHC